MWGVLKPLCGPPFFSFFFRLLTCCLRLGEHQTGIKACQLTCLPNTHRLPQVFCSFLLAWKDRLQSCKERKQWTVAQEERRKGFGRKRGKGERENQEGAVMRKGSRCEWQYDGMLCVIVILSRLGGVCVSVCVCAVIEESCVHVCVLGFRERMLDTGLCGPCKNMSYSSQSINLLMKVKYS